MTKSSMQNESNKLLTEPSSTLHDKNIGAISDAPQSSKLSELRHSNPHEAGMSQTVRPAGGNNAADPLWAFISSIETPPNGKGFDILGGDGVWRAMQWLPTPPDQPTATKVYDAKPMSPELIKMYLDTTPWSQETEDRFRGVDGRDVPEEQWLNPPKGVIPPMGTKNERIEELRKTREDRVRFKDGAAVGETSGEPLPLAGDMKSDYDLNSR